MPRTVVPWPAAGCNMDPETAAKIASGAVTKGDVLAVSRVAGIQAAKQTPMLLPLCHPLLVGSVYVNFRIEHDHVLVEAQVDTVDRTGVEMEALTACAISALNIYDMCKSIDRAMTIGELELQEKTGGRSGTYRRAPRDDVRPRPLKTDGTTVPHVRAWNLSGEPGSTGMRKGVGTLPPSGLTRGR